MSSKINIEDIDSVWKDINENYKDFYDRVSFLFKRDELNGNKNIVLIDKVHLLISDMKDIVQSLEKVCNHMDCNNVNKGMIPINNSIPINNYVLINNSIPINNSVIIKNSTKSKFTPMTKSKINIEYDF